MHLMAGTVGDWLPPGPPPAPLMGRADRQRVRQIHRDQFLLADPVRYAVAQEQLKELLAVIEVLRDPGAWARSDALLDGWPLGARLGRMTEADQWYRAPPWELRALLPECDGRQQRQGSGADGCCAGHHSAAAGRLRYRRCPLSAIRERRGNRGV